jgi:hypothetical protein
MLRKRFILGLTILLTFCFSSSVYAMSNDIQTPVKKITYKATEIKDIDKLIDRAKKGISDIPKEKFGANYTLKNNNTNNEITENSLSTTQLLQVATEGDATINEYATTTVSLIPMASLSQYDENYDSSYGVKAYSTIYWTTTTINNVWYAALTSTSGGWTISDTSIGLSNRHVQQGESGTGSNGMVINPSYDFYPTSNTYSHSVSWAYVNISGLGWYSFGNNTNVTLTRQSTSWTLNHTNLYHN